jgi:hypothetical protein
LLLYGGIIIYLIIGTIVYQIALGILEEKDPRMTFSTYNRVQLLSLIFLWFPLLICALFGGKND